MDGKYINLLTKHQKVPYIYSYIPKRGLVHSKEKRNKNKDKTMETNHSYLLQLLPERLWEKLQTLLFSNPYFLFCKNEYKNLN